MNFHQWWHMQLMLWEHTAAHSHLLSLLFFAAAERLIYVSCDLVRTDYSSSSSRPDNANIIHVAVSVASALHMSVLSLHMYSHDHHPQPFCNPHSC
jgi:hypothetical protein